jgi:hypothetical protein
VADLDAVMKVVASEENMSSFTDGHGMRAVNKLRAVEALRSNLRITETEATDLGRKAVERLGGRFELVEHQGGIVGVAPNWELREDWWIPQDAVRG